MHTLQRHSLLLQERGTNLSFDVIWESRTVHIMLTIVHDAYTAAPPTRNFHKLFIAMKVENIPSPPLEKADMQKSYCG